MESIIPLVALMYAALVVWIQWHRWSRSARRQSPHTQYTRRPRAARPAPPIPIRLALGPVQAPTPTVPTVISFELRPQPEPPSPPAQVATPAEPKAALPPRKIVPSPLKGNWQSLVGRRVEAVVTTTHQHDGYSRDQVYLFLDGDEHYEIYSYVGGGLGGTNGLYPAGLLRTLSSRALGQTVNVYGRVSAPANGLKDPEE